MLCWHRATNPEALAAIEGHMDRTLTFENCENLNALIGWVHLELFALNDHDSPEGFESEDGFGYWPEFVQDFYANVSRQARGEWP